MDVLGIAQQGLQQAQGQFDKSAQQMAGVSSGSSQKAGDSVSLSDAAVSLVNSQEQYESGLGVVHVAKEMEKATLNLLA
jgi:hypothetical protein